MTSAPANSLPIATCLSITLHLAALLSWPQPPGPDGAQSAARPSLDVHLAPISHPAVRAPVPSVLPETYPVAATSPPTLTSTPKPAYSPAAPAPASPSDASDPPLPVFPIEALSRLPTLATEISPEDWPSTPGAPSGSFRIEVDVGADGRVMRVNPVCAPEMCEAATIYSGTIVGWRFVPAEILGHRVSSRIQVEFEIGAPESAGFSAAPLAPSRAATPVVRPAEAAP